MRHLISLVRQKYRGRERLVLVTSGLAIFALLGVLPLDTTRAEMIDAESEVFTRRTNLLPATSEGRLEAEVNVLLRLQPDDQ